MERKKRERHHGVAVMLCAREERKGKNAVAWKTRGGGELV